MGLIKAIKGAAGGVMADQWKEFFYCDSLSSDVLMTRASKKTTDRSSNTKGDDSIISKGSVVAVADGQCMIITDQGKVAELCAEPGEYIYDSSTEPTIFAGDLGPNIMNVFQNLGKRFTFGGEAPKDQRVYFINTKDIMGNKYGTPSPIPFRVVDNNIHLDMEIGVKCFGEYVYRITNPILFYTNVVGNVRSEYRREEIDGQLKSDLLKYLQPAFAKISEMGIRYSALPGHTVELANAVNEAMASDWGEKRGIEIISMGVSSVTANEEDAALIKELQKKAVFRDPSMAAAGLADATQEAMVAAANNTATGPMMAFAGMNMAGQAAAPQMNALFGMAGQQQAAAAPAAPAQGGWTCSCGTVNTGKFCSNCGTPQPAPATAWTCSCGTQNTGKFCSNCGSPAPAGPWTCSCGTQNTGKFCSNCGSPRA